MCEGALGGTSDRPIPLAASVNWRDLDGFDCCRYGAEGNARRHLGSTHPICNLRVLAVFGLASIAADLVCEGAVDGTLDRPIPLAASRAGGMWMASIAADVVSSK